MLTPDITAGAALDSSLNNLLVHVSVLPLQPFVAHDVGLEPLSDLLGARGEDKLAGRIDFAETMARVHAAMARGTPSLATLRDTQSGTLVICGGGPSIGDLDEIKAIRALQKKGAKVWAVNKTHDFLLTKGIVPWACCLLDPMPWVADYVRRPRKDVIYAVASQCDARVFEALKGFDARMWHAGVDYFGEGYPTQILQSTYANRDWLVIPGPTTVGLRSILVGYALGFRDFHLFGLDSSLRGDALHAYAKPKPPDAPEGVVTLRTKAGAQSFRTNAHMARQALDFEETVERIAGMVRERVMAPISIAVHGDGLIPALAECYGWRVK
ncbi:MAG: 6-hydroxymethylpterin diphosphokinase MptE-like protein [Rhodospirillaceae bacterium]|nr:6-hydroxymethylpterin diphosphokinase MptE-like protein [Rhodospirillaceae bacterium]